MICEPIAPAAQADIRRIEARCAFDSAVDLANRMSSIPEDQKRAAGRTILHRLRCYLALSDSAVFWEGASRQGWGVNQA